jgi:uncharacterized membrane protein
MLNRFLLLIFKGLLTVLPLTLTLYFLYWLASSIEAAVSPYFESTFYFPGLGIVTVLLALAAIGTLVNAYVVKLFIAYGNEFIEKLPLIKTLYGAIKDAVELFQSNKKEEYRKPVSVEIAPDMHAIGFITNTEIAKTLFPDEEKLPVYMPLSYQIGGYTLYVPRNKIRYLDIDVETAMRIAVTGGTSIKGNSAESVK